MKLSKKALVTLIGGTVLLSLALVGCAKTEKAPVTEPIEQTPPEVEVEADKIVEGDESSSVETVGVDAEVVENRAISVYEKLVEGLELPASIQLDDNLLADMYGLNAGDVISYCVAMPMMNVHATEIGVFEIKDGNVDIIETAIAKRQVDLEKTWETYLPDQLELVKKHRIIKNDAFVIYIISDKLDEITNRVQGVLDAQ